MASDKNIVSELEKTLHIINIKTLTLFRENNFLISKDQWAVLNRIVAEEGSNQKDIAKDTFKDPAALTRMLDLLANKGFVQRKASKSDRRTFDIFSTVEGNRMVNRMSPIMEDFQSSIKKGLPERDQIALLQLLNKLQGKLII
tara:strand:- start:44573 stop:45001 length:429 start_codon:yes stop_codon:yes gene_type:complete